MTSSSTDLAMPPEERYDMTSETGPYRLTLAELEALPVPESQRARRELIRSMERRLFFVADKEIDGYVVMDDRHALAQPVLHWMPGVLIREMRLFPGLFVIGKRHAQQHFCIVTRGRATVMTEKGWDEIVGPTQFMSPAGTKRALWVHEEMVWMTIHRTDAKSLEEAEAELMLVEPEPELEAA